ncbi:DNA-binding protein [Plantactinospora sp. GCM10030261]|uniref:DNA-binding protein n=1 Tax=Plantactinospora sp. GCM10030261 TaxID=3273420 RepID=UPI003613F3FF
MSYSDGELAVRETEACDRLLDRGAASLPRPPWLRGSQPPSAVDLIRFALWRSTSGDLDEDGVLAALTLLAAARAEMDQVESAMLFVARSQGLSWPQISRALGLASAQAAQQRYDRVTGRVEQRGSAAS